MSRVVCVLNLMSMLSIPDRGMGRVDHYPKYLVTCYGQPSSLKQLSRPTLSPPPSLSLLLSPSLSGRETGVTCMLTVPAPARQQQLAPRLAGLAQTGHSPPPLCSGSPSPAWLSPAPAEYSTPVPVAPAPHIEVVMSSKALPAKPTCHWVPNAATTAAAATA